MMIKNKPELLSPAGGMQQLKAAVQNGADAVYMGGPFFNARIKAANFTDDDMLRAIDYAHERGVRIYVTLNTLIKDDELYKAFSYVDFLYGAGADALIVQDIGISRIIRRYFPHIPMHLSTQGTLYNKWGVEAAKELGFSRIVPARELSIEEISEISNACHSSEPSCEIEVFVHGALCMCYSGQCQMSRIIGGINKRSGNRGLCAQPCRLMYENDKGEKGYFLSPKDICYIKRIPELYDAGVDSFKIEGRMKSAEYVAIVTGIYRKYIDMYANTGKCDVSDEDMDKLLQIFNRGGFTEGYLKGDPGENILSGESPKNTGVYIGKVVGRQKLPLKRKGTAGENMFLVDIKLEGKVDKGDGIEIRGNNLTGNVVTYKKELSKGVVRVGDIKEKVEKGDRVYKVTDEKLLRAAEETYLKKERKKTLLDMDFAAKAGTYPTLKMVDRFNGKSVLIKGNKKAEEARKTPSDEKKVTQQLPKLGATPFKADVIRVNLDGIAVISVSEINEMRRRGVDALLRTRREASKSERVCLGEKRIIKEAQKEGIAINKNTKKNEKGLGLPLDQDDLIKFIPIKKFMEEKIKLDNDVLPYIPRISKGNLDRYIEEHFTDIVKKVKDTGIMVDNIGWIVTFRDAGVKVFGGSGLNVCNMQSIKAYKEIGAEVIKSSYELIDEDDIPLMITEHDLKTTTLIDRKGIVYDVFKDESEGREIIKKREEKGK